MTRTAALYYTERRPGVALPTVTGKVHGIVGLNPAEVQCDACLVVRTGIYAEKIGITVILVDITFNPRRYERGDKRRLCRECRVAHWKGDRE